METPEKKECEIKSEKCNGKVQCYQHKNKHRFINPKYSCWPCIIHGYGFKDRPTYSINLKK